MERFWYGLLLPLIEMAVMFVENFNTPRLASGKTKRMRAFKYVKDRLFYLGGILGSFGVPDDSLILGMIDAAVLARNKTGEFATDSDPAYDLAAPAVFAVVDGNGKKTHLRFEGDELVPATMKRGPGGELFPVEPVEGTTVSGFADEATVLEDEPDPDEVAPVKTASEKRAAANRKKRAAKKK